MAKSINLKSAENARNKLTVAQEKRIRRLYENVIKNIHNEVKSLEGRENISSILRTQYLNKLERHIQKEIENISVELNKEIKSNVKEVSEEVVKDNQEWLSKVGLEVRGGFSNVPSSIVSRIVTGNLYESKTPLSERIWGAEKKTLNDINYIIGQGVTQNKSAYDIAKDLEKYVSPTAKKDWEWSKVYPNTSKRIDYNAQRLARTMVSHAYQQSIIMTTKNNPFVTGIQWVSAGIHGRTCQLCLDRDGQIFKVNELPLDHPNGLCTFVVVTEKSNEQIIDDIAKWYKSPNGTYPDIDKFAKSLGYTE